MLYSLLKFSESIKSPSSTANIPIKKSKKSRKGEQLLEIIVFDCDKHEVTSITERKTENTEHEWLYIGNASSQNSQDVITTDNLRYILGVEEDGSEVPSHKFSIKILAERLNGEPGEALRAVLSWYDPSKIDRKNFNWKASLYTVRVILNGKQIDIAKTPEYKDYITDKSFAGKAGVHESVRCQICGAKMALDDPDYPKGTLLKVYVTDKKGFSSGVSKSPEAWLRSHAICPRCRNRLLMAVSRLDDVSIRIGRLKAYVLILAQEPGDFKLSSSGWILKDLEELFIRESSIESDNMINEKYLRQPIQVTLIFGESEKSKFRLWRMIPDIPVFRLIEFARTAWHVTRDGPEGLGLYYLPSRTSLDLSFDSLYKVLPVEDKGRHLRPAPFLNLVESILLDYPIDEDYIYEEFVKVLRCKRYDTCQNSAVIPLDLEDVAVLQASFIKVFKLLGIMSSQSESIQPEGNLEIYSYAKKLSLNKGQEGLFLLGAVMAYIGREQYKKGDEKAILDKIDYEGMDWDDVVTLVNRVFESARHHKVLNETEVLLGDAQSKILEGKDLLSNPAENVFYILSGYSFQTKLIRSRGAKKGEAE